MRSEAAIAAWLDWFADAGVRDWVGDPGGAQALAERAPAARPVSRPVPDAGTPVARTLPIPGLASGGGGAAADIARRCTSMDELSRALESFDGCSLKTTATRLCFADGALDAPLMVIGEAPGAEEDRQGKPFVGPSGRLLDQILAAIGLDRRSVWITNAVFWRPPGNRKPTPHEIAVCRPFLERQIELLAPRHMVLLGLSAAEAVLGRSGAVGQMRRERLEFTAGHSAPIPVTVTYHPSNLLRTPLNKKHVWRDFLVAARSLRHI